MGLRGFPSLVAWFSRVDRQYHPRGLQLSFKAPPHAPDIRKYPASPGIRFFSPPSFCSIARPLPDCRNSPSDLGCKTKISFRSRGFSPPQRLAPHNDAGCVATRADHGVHCVARDRQPGRTRSFSSFPAMRIPLEEFPLSVAVPHHCGPCPLAVTTQLAFLTESDW